MSKQMIGLFMVVMGLVFLLGHKLPFVGRLPGDFYIQGRSFRMAIPLGTCLLISLILSLLFSLFGKD